MLSLSQSLTLQISECSEGIEREEWAAPVKQLCITPIYLQSSAQISLPLCANRIPGIYSKLSHLKSLKVKLHRYNDMYIYIYIHVHMVYVDRIPIAALLLPQLDHKALAQRGIASVMVVRGLGKVRRHKNERMIIIIYHNHKLPLDWICYQKEEIVEDYILTTLASQSPVRCEKNLRRPPSVRKVQCLGAICFDRSRQVNHSLISSIFLDSRD